MYTLICRDDASNQALALRWGAEQLEGARQALNAARAALKKLKAIEKKRKQKVCTKCLLLLPTHAFILQLMTRIQDGFLDSHSHAPISNPSCASQLDTVKTIAPPGLKIHFME